MRDECHKGIEFAKKGHLMHETYLNLIQDKQIKRYFVFLLSFSLLFLIAGTLFSAGMTRRARTMLLSHDEAVATSLLEQGIPETVIAAALTDTAFTDTALTDTVLHDTALSDTALSDTALSGTAPTDTILTDTASTQSGADLLAKLGITQAQDVRFLPSLSRFRRSAQALTLAAALLLSLLLLAGTFLFLWKRDRLYRQASSVIEDYINGDYSRRLPHLKEGAVYQLFSSMDRLATMLQAQKETEQKSRVFLRNTISDISHQLKTPLAALSLYQEIMENEPDHPAVIREFAWKTGRALRRMEQLILSMLKITRLDAGNVVFDRKRCRIAELIRRALSELTTRAENEAKELIIEGSPDETLLCDMAWTCEAIGNIVKNALDHTTRGGVIRIFWETSPVSVSILISDDGEGIAPEDIHHIFKRFYRSAGSSDTQGIGLGLPLAKSIIEGQGGAILVNSTPHVGTTFTLSFAP